MEEKKSEYALAGVDYTKLEPFKMAMVLAGKRTREFPNRRGVFIDDDILHSHGGVFEYRGIGPFKICQTTEGLGNKNWIAEWMRQIGGTSRTFYDFIGIDAALMAVNDLIAQGAMPVTYTDEVAAGDSDWFMDEQRSNDLAEGFVRVCKESGMALVAGESPALKYLIKAEPPVRSAPSLSGCVVGIIAPSSNRITGHKLAVGDHILGVKSSGLHANGVSLIIKRALTMPDQFMTKLENGNTLGEEALIPTRSYVALIEGLLKDNVDIHALLPGTGDGVGKVAFDKRSFTYRIHTWVELPIIFQFMLEIGVSLIDVLKTFNCGIGYYIFVPEHEAERVMRIGQFWGYDVVDIGVVEEGERKTIFEPKGITLPPPGE